jgi:transposase
VRKGFNGLAHLVQCALAADPLSGHLVVIRNRRGDRLKILYRAGDWFALWYRRLEKGTCQFPIPSDRVIGSLILERDFADFVKSSW